MSDNDDSYDVYGDTDPNNAPDDGFGQDTSAGDGLPGFPVEGLPDRRAGAFGSGRGLLGMARVSDLAGRPGYASPATLQFGPDRWPSDGKARLMLASNSRSPGPAVASDGRQSYPMPPAYMPDGHGGVRLRPDFAATHPKTPLDFGGMAHNIDWVGVLADLATIGFGAVGGAGAGAAEGAAGSVLAGPRGLVGSVLGSGGAAGKAQQKAPRWQSPGSADRATNGLP